MHKAETTPPRATAAPTHRSPDGDPDRGRPLITVEEYELYKSQLDDLRSLRDRDFRQLLRDARTFVASDAAEEVVQFQNDQLVLDVRIAQLEALLHEATVVRDGDHPANLVALGRVVTVRYARTGHVVRYHLGGAAVSPGAANVSARSPVGQALLGRSAGDIVRVALPRGRVAELQILSIAPTPATAASR